MPAALGKRAGGRLANEAPEAHPNAGQSAWSIPSASPRNASWPRWFGRNATREAIWSRFRDLSGFLTVGTEQVRVQLAWELAVVPLDISRSTEHTPNCVRYAEA